MSSVLNPVIKKILFDRPQFRFLILGLSFLAAVLGLLAAYYQKVFIDSLTSLETFGTTSHELSVLLLAFGCFLFASIFNQSNHYLGIREGLISQRKLSADLYSQAITLKSESLEKRTVGEVVSLYATDIPASTILLEQTLPFGASTFFPILLTPFALNALIGNPLWETFVAVFIVATINTALAFRQSQYFSTFKQLAALRTSFVNEWLQNIRTLKILNWLQPFESKIFSIREQETENRLRMVTNGQIMNSITSHAPFVFNIIAGVILVLNQNRELSAGEIWAVFWVLGIFLNRPLRQLPWFFTFGFDALTSSRRLQSFFNLRSFTDYRVNPHPGPDNKSSAASTNTASPAPSLLQLRGLRWSNQQGLILNNLNLDIREGEKIAILGEVGSGKSALLLCLLGELQGHFDSFYYQGEPVKGAVSRRLRRHMNYVPQESFLMNSTLRDNISFEYEKSPLQDSELQLHLQRVDFDPDFEGFRSGLNTPIGERGVNLSGGQKQRLSLARSIAQSRDIILIDDAMSQLDAVTEQKILEELFQGPLKNKTVILTTHRRTALKFVDTVYEMSEGRLKPGDSAL